MKIFVLITCIIEFLAGLVLLFAPTVVPELQDANELSLGWARMYGAAALGLSYFAFQVWRKFESADLVMAFLQTFTIFHTGVFVAAERAFRLGGFANPGIYILHLLLAIATVSFLYQMRKKQRA